MSYFYLFTSCIPVKGYNRSLIVDTQRKIFFFIPNALYHILSECRTKTVRGIRSSFEQKNIVDEYFDFLINENLGMYINSLKKFPPLNMEYDVPRQITNAIIEVSEKSEHNYDSIISQLSQLNTEALELHLYDRPSISCIINIMNKIQGSSLRSITIIMPYLEGTEMFNVLDKYPRITSLIFYNSGKDDGLIYNENVKVLYKRQKDISPENCGNISPKYFSFNLNHVCESLCYNICLNKKLCITIDGKIKNCPGCVEDFGNVNKDLLCTVINSAKFQRMWKIKKDDIKVCKDCEMRYICHDCRIHIVDKNNIYSKPSKCSYNPYKSEW